MNGPEATLPIITEEQIKRELELLFQLKSRVTGSPEQEMLIGHIEKQLTESGLEVFSDELSFTRWLPNDAGVAPSLSIGGEDVSIASVVPYSGCTGGDGVAGELVHLSGVGPTWGKARGKIAVVEVDNFLFPFSAIVDTWEGDTPWPATRNPFTPSIFAGMGLSKAKRAGVSAVVFVWRNMSDENALGQYLPFTFDYQDIPTVFVSGRAGDKVVEAARANAETTLVLDYQLVPNSTTRTLWTLVEGTSGTDEAVLVVTHTDGVNAVEENGHIATVAMARAARVNPPERTTIFVFTSGHMRIPAVTSEGQATQRFLTDHPELWAGGEGQRRAVAGLAIEHLGAREFVDSPESGQYRPTGRLEPELLYATSPEMARLARSAWRTEVGTPTRISKPHPLIHFGEGEPLLHSGIPAISLVTAPTYLLAEQSGDESQLVDIAAVQRQTQNFERLYRHISSVSTTGFGHVEKPSKSKRVLDVGSILKTVALTRLPAILHPHEN